MGLKWEVAPSLPQEPHYFSGGSSQMQWFASNYISKYYPDRPESIHQCKILDYKDFFGDCPYTRNYDDCHKMTADEIMKEFTKIANIKYDKSNPNIFG